MTNIGGGRVLRVCDLCGGVDDHPRHVLVGATPDVHPRPPDAILQRVLDNARDLPDGEAARLVRDLVDTSSSDRHMDCCRAAGCPDGTCDEVTAGAEDARGVDLLMHLTRAED